jgi:putrescine transport system ATP-binding protein
MALARAQADDRPGDNRLIGTIADIAYFGDFFLYHVALEDGRRLRVSQPVLTRVTRRGLDWEDRVAVSWPPEASVVLPE